MNEAGRTSVTPPPWWEQTGRARVSALLVAARSGDEAAWADLVGTIEPFLQVLVRSSGADPTAGDEIARTLYARLRQELDGIDDEDTLIGWVSRSIPRHTAGQYAEVDRTLNRLSPTERHLLLATLRNEANYADLARSLDMPVGAIGPTRQRLLRKIWSLSRLRRSTQEFDPGTTREDLEVALQIHKSSPGDAQPERESGWVHAVARVFGLVTPPPSRTTTNGDMVVAACRDVTGATRDILRELTAVLSERAALASEAEDLR